MVEFPFSIECKNNEIWDLTDLLKGIRKEDGIESWWVQCATDADQAKKIPILIFTKNHEEIFCIVPSYIFNTLFKFCGVSSICFKFDELVIFLLNDLLELNYKDINDSLKSIYLNDRPIYDG